MQNHLSSGVLTFWKAQGEVPDNLSKNSVLFMMSDIEKGSQRQMRYNYKGDLKYVHVLCHHCQQTPIDPSL